MESKVGKIEFGNKDFWTPVSSTVVKCRWCGAHAIYSGSPEDINKAATEFYKLHDSKEHKMEKK